MLIFHMVGNLQKNNEVKMDDVVKTMYRSCREELNLFNSSSLWKYILQQKDWTQLRFLSVQSCGIIAHEISILIGLEWPKLKELKISDNQIGNEGVAIFVTKKWPKLHKLILRKNQISWKGMEKLLASDLTAQLKQLVLKNNPIGSKGAKVISKMRFPLLVALQIEECQLNNNGIKHITKSKIPALTTFFINSNKAGIESWASLPTFEFCKIQRISINQGSHCYWERNFFIITNCPQSATVYGWRNSNKNIETLKHHNKMHEEEEK